jgi:hypothetical protein
MSFVTSAIAPAVHFFILWDGTKSLGTAATFGLLYKPQMIDEGDCGAIGGMRIGRGNRSTRRKPAPAPLCPSSDPCFEFIQCNHFLSGHLILRIAQKKKVQRRKIRKTKGPPNWSLFSHPAAWEISVQTLTETVSKMNMCIAQLRYSVVVVVAVAAVVVVVVVVVVELQKSINFQHVWK